MSTVEEMAEFIILWDLVQNIQLTEHNDEIRWKWTINGSYTSKSAYLAQMHGTFSAFDGKSICMAGSCRRKAEIFCVVASTEQDLDC